MFLNKLQNLFCVPHTNFVSATNVAGAGKRGNICVSNNVPSFASTFTLPIVINVPTRGLLVVERKDSLVLWLAKFKHQKNCL